jgi:hypothetical protein
MRGRTAHPFLELPMGRDEPLNGEAVDLRPLVGLLHGVPIAVVDRLTVNAIKEHRKLADRAENLFHALPEEVRTGKVAGCDAHIDYLEATIAMQAQMSALTTLLHILGYIPKV